MSKHMRGPLTVREIETWPFGWEAVNAAGEVVFSEKSCAVSSKSKSFSDVKAGLYFGKHQAEVIESIASQEADFRLRSAAPEMLEALEDALRFNEAYDVQEDESPLMAEDQCNLTEKIRSILRKAKGE